MANVEAEKGEMEWKVDLFRKWNRDYIKYKKVQKSINGGENGEIMGGVHLAVYINRYKYKLSEETAVFFTRLLSSHLILTEKTGRRYTVSSSEYI